MHVLHWSGAAALLSAGLSFGQPADATNSAAAASDYLPLSKAKSAKIRPVVSAQAGVRGYLGVTFASGDAEKLVVDAVQSGSPAASAGTRKGDIVVRLDGEPVGQTEVFREHVQAKTPGEKVSLSLIREGKPVEVVARLTALSRPMKPQTSRVSLGVRLRETADGDEGPTVEAVDAGSPAAAAGIRNGDVLLKLDDNVVEHAARLADVLVDRRPGDSLPVVLRRAGREVSTTVKLTSSRRPGGRVGVRGGRGGLSSGPPTTPWTRKSYRLAVVGVEFADVKHNAGLDYEVWTKALFGRGDGAGDNLRDYFAAQSYGEFKVEGKFFGWVGVAKKRNEYSQGTGVSNLGALPSETLGKLLARDGDDALKDFDGVFVVYAGERVRGNRGAVYSPHAGQFTHRLKAWPYLMSFEGGERIAPLGSYVREFAYLLGLPDLAARQENAGSKGVGTWCMLGGQFSDRPQNLCCWAREQLGWIKPVVVDPTVEQKLSISALTASPAECLKVLIRTDGSEYFLLENRRKADWDARLPGEGLLVWHVMDGRPELVESHGVEGAAGPRTQPEFIPFPSRANNSFTPYTTPTSRSPRGGGLPVHITEIRRLADGRIGLQLGVAYD